MITIPNTPILDYFRRLELSAPEHFNQSVMLTSSRRLNVFTFKASLGILCQYHDMLRAVWDGSQLRVRDINAGSLFHFEEHDLKTSLDVTADILPLCEALQASIDITYGPMMRVAVFHLPEKDTVLMVIHHLVVDGVSWRIIAEDLNRIYVTLLQGRLSVNLPKRKCSFAQYAQALNDYAGSSELREEEGYWQNVVDRINSNETLSRGRSGAVSYVSFQSDDSVSSLLLGEGYRKFGFDINALLLTALSCAWKTVTGQTFISVAMEGHGREPFGSHPLELERLVGWFTSIYPVALLFEDSDFKTQVAAVQTMLQKIPSKGLGYGVLSYIKLKESLRCKPLMTFNYLGSFDESSPDSIFTFDYLLPQGHTVSPKNNPGTSLAINCATVGGRLTGTLFFDNVVFDDIKAQTLCDSFVSQLKFE